MPVITLEQLENASEDALALEQFMNGSAATVVNLRLGGTVPSLQKLIADLLVNGPYVAGGTWNGIVPINTYVIHHIATSVGFSLPQDLVGSAAYCRTAPTDTRVITLYKRTAGTVIDTAIGTITFAAGERVGTFVFAADVAFAIGDTLIGIGPGVQDATWAYIALSLLGTKVEG